MFHLVKYSISRYFIRFHLFRFTPNQKKYPCLLNLRWNRAIFFHWIDRARNSLGFCRNSQKFLARDWNLFSMKRSWIVLMLVNGRHVDSRAQLNSCSLIKGIDTGRLTVPKTCHSNAGWTGITCVGLTIIYVIVGTPARPNPDPGARVID